MISFRESKKALVFLCKCFISLNSQVSQKEYLFELMGFCHRRCSFFEFDLLSAYDRLSCSDGSLCKSDHIGHSEP